MKQREIKFRAWDGENMTFLPLAHDWKPEFFEVNNIMQYTGLKDKNKAEGYEDDIIKVTHSDREVENMVLVYAAPSYKLKDKFGSIWSFTLFNDITIIGNIHENKDLL